MKLGLNKNRLEIDLLEKGNSVGEVCLKYGFKEIILSYKSFFETLKCQIDFHWNEYPTREKGTGPESRLYLVYNHAKNRSGEIFLARFNGNGNFWQLPDKNTEIIVTHFADIPYPKGLMNFDDDFDIDDIDDLEEDDDEDEDEDDEDILAAKELLNKSKLNGTPYPVPI